MKQIHELTVSPNSLRLFVDETGHEHFADPNYPIFGLGGCGIIASSYEHELVEPWRKIKEKFLGNPEYPLHAAELVSKKDAQLIKSIANFFVTQPIFRLAAILNNQTVRPSGWEPYKLTAYIFVKRIEAILGHCNPDSINIVFEDSHRGNKFASKYFGSFILSKKTGKEIPFNRFFMPKQVRNPGLEVADFIINAAGGQVRSRLAGNNATRRDFDCVFKSAPSKFISFFEVSAAEWKSHDSS